MDNSLLLNQDQLPLVQEFSQMTKEDAASYSINYFEFGDAMTYIVDSDDVLGMGASTIVNDDSGDGVQNSYGIVIVNKSTNESYAKNVVGTILDFTGSGGQGVLPMYNAISPIVILPDGNSYQSNTLKEHGVGYRSNVFSDTYLL